MKLLIVKKNSMLMKLSRGWEGWPFTQNFGKFPIICSNKFKLNIFRHLKYIFVEISIIILCCVINRIEISKNMNFNSSFDSFEKCWPPPPNSSYFLISYNFSNHCISVLRHFNIAKYFRKFPENRKVIISFERWFNVLLKKWKIF